MLRPARFAAFLSFASLMALPAAAAEPLSSVPLPELVTTKLPAPPKIDGRLSPGEWDSAAACTGFMTAFKNELSHIQSVAWVAYDDEYLYVAMKNYRGENYTFLKKHGREPDDEAIVATNPLEMRFFLERAGCVVERVECTDRYVARPVDFLLNLMPTRFVMFNAFLIAKRVR